MLCPAELFFRNEIQAIPRDAVCFIPAPAAEHIKAGGCPVTHCKCCVYTTLCSGVLSTKQYIRKLKHTVPEKRHLLATQGRHQASICKNGSVCRAVRCSVPAPHFSGDVLAPPEVRGGDGT